MLKSLIFVVPNLKNADFGHDFCRRANFEIFI